MDLEQMIASAVANSPDGRIDSTTIVAIYKKCFDAVSEEYRAYMVLAKERVAASDEEAGRLRSGLQKFTTETGVFVDVDGITMFAYYVSDIEALRALLVAKK